jgi:hypothetical protein
VYLLLSRIPDLLLSLYVCSCCCSYQYPISRYVSCIAHGVRGFAHLDSGRGFRLALWVISSHETIHSRIYQHIHYATPIARYMVIPPCSLEILHSLDPDPLNNTSDVRIFTGILHMLRYIQASISHSAKRTMRKLRNGRIVRSLAIGITSKAARGDRRHVSCLRKYSGPYSSSLLLVVCP